TRGCDLCRAVSAQGVGQPKNDKGMAIAVLVRVQHGAAAVARPIPPAILVVAEVRQQETGPALDGAAILLIAGEFVALGKVVQQARLRNQRAKVFVQGLPLVVKVRQEQTLCAHRAKPFWEDFLEQNLTKPGKLNALLRRYTRHGSIPSMVTRRIDFNTGGDRETHGNVVKVTYFHPLVKPFFIRTGRLT